MSLIQHVSALEGIDREPETDIGEDFTPIRRKISYDVLQPPTQPVPVVEPAPGIPAYKHSALKRIAQVAFTIFACWVASGIVFGFAALKPVLVEEGVYHDQCTEDELRDGIELCKQQDLGLNFFFTVASITANVSALPVGTILDRYGSRVCGFIGCFIMMAGSLLMASSFRRPGFEGLLAGNFFLALSGTFIFVPSFQIANAFPRYAGSIVALITGAFDASAAVFLFYQSAYEASGRTFTPDRFFLGYLVVPALIFLALLTFMPKRDYVPPFELENKMEWAEDATHDVHSSDDEIESDRELRRVRSKRAERRKLKARKLHDVLGSKDEIQSRAEKEEDRQQVSQVWGVLHGLPARQQMITPWFILITLMTILQMIRMNYFIATIRAQYEYMLNSIEAAEQINTFFDVALPVGGVLFTPFIGFLLDRLSVPSLLALIVAFTTIIGVLNSIPTLWAGYMTVVLFVLLRPLYYSAMSDYATKVFGFATFGRVYGTIICLSGLANFSQYGLDALTHHTFHENPIPINAFLTVSGFVVGVALVGFVTVQGHRLSAQAEADEEREPLLEEDEEDSDGYGSIGGH
ncbi:Major facilitator superfamily domain general substrate transporter [Penicillium longicatenatum]|uniref:Major facilitator superfamily domain general substrate transporter n=1 Tax=Penicillium longicatenatum TaxID=1561947 RepID=UPI002548217C|nr:Major facilitator superfamily domain general substrate transporter [Penicillium longicatenatum]KAJ5640055.1 Major facilitator superfamily domain general substrate transporter [Penicillium longicatenatum]